MVYFVIVWVGKEWDRWHKENLSIPPSPPKVRKDKHIVYASKDSGNFLKQRIKWKS